MYENHVMLGRDGLGFAGETHYQATTVSRQNLLACGRDINPRKNDEYKTKGHSKPEIARVGIKATMKVRRINHWGVQSRRGAH